MVKKAILTTLCVFNFCFAMEESEPISSRPLTFKQLQKGDSVKPCIPVSVASIISLYKELTLEDAKRCAVESLNKLGAKLGQKKFTFLCGYDESADNKLAALVAFQPDGDDAAQVQVEILAVLPEYQKLGLLKLLTDKVLEYSPETAIIIAHVQDSQKINDWAMKMSWKKIDRDGRGASYTYSAPLRLFG